MKQSIMIPYEYVNRFLHIPKGSFASRYLQLYSAFAMSGLLHHVGTLNIVGMTWEVSKYQMYFFLMQAVAITFEDYMIWCGRKLGLEEGSESSLRRWTWSATER